jgi:hypothetical protein
MTILERLRNRPSRDAGDPGSPAPSAAGGDETPIPGYDNLDVKEIGARLTGLSQVELAAVESYERSHENRPEVLAGLRYLRGSEPLPGYDAMDSEAIAQALAGADRGTVKAVRVYERKFKRRREVLDEVARVLPTSQASPEEVRAREQQTALVREGFKGRAKTAGGLADDRSARKDREGTDDPRVDS